MPLVIISVFSPELDVFIAESVIGIVGLVVLWMRWREAVRLQTVLPLETEDV
jgi:hypothetical protein